MEKNLSFKLDFACVGAQKCGTTSLHDILANHPNIILPRQKEILYFEIDEYYNSGSNVISKEYFSTSITDSKFGLINPNFDLNEQAIERLKKHNPRIKIIYIVRNPIERAYSHFLMSSARGIETLNFREALKKEKHRIENDEKSIDYITNEFGHYAKNHFGYAFRSNYIKFVNTLNKNFHKEDILIIHYDDLIKNTKNVLKIIQKHIDVPVFELPVLHSNQSWEPRVKSINSLLYDTGNRNKVLRFFIRFLSNSVKSKLKIFLRRINQKPAKKKKLNSSTYDSSEFQKQYEFIKNFLQKTYS